MSQSTYKLLDVSGDVSIERAASLPAWDVLKQLILLVGPTGSGKSSFIEALAGPKSSLGIANNQLEGFTQELSIFKVVNATYRTTYPIFLVDCPGFADRKLSANEVILKIRKWMDHHHKDHFSYILYFTPITDNRVPGSKRNLISMFQDLCAVGAGRQRICVVTTLWDTICNDDMRSRAHRNFKQLKTDFWKESLCVTKFHNTQASSMTVLEDIYSEVYIQIISFRKKSPKFVYDDLLHRIAVAQQAIQLSTDELSDPATQSNEERLAIELTKRDEAHVDLKRFTKQLVNLGQPPRGPPKYVYDILLTRIAIIQQVIQLVNDEISHADARASEELQRTLIDERTAAQDSLKKFVGDLVDFGPPPPGYAFQIFPGDLLNFGQNLKQSWRIKKREMFGKKQLPT